jgi:hypothetical protein
MPKPTFPENADEYRLEAIERVLGAVARKAGLKIEALDIPEMKAGDHNGHVTKETEQRRHTVRQFVLRILGS